MKRFDASQGPRIIGPADGKFVDLGSCGVRFMVWAEESGGGFSLVEHPIPPRHLASPVHRHSKEDEYSYVVEGRLGALLGEQVVFANPGDGVTEIVKIPNRGHSLTIDHGWREVAETALKFVKRFAWSLGNGSALLRMPNPIQVLNTGPAMTGAGRALQVDEAGT